MADRFKYRKPNPRVQQFPFTNKHVLLFGSVLFIGSAVMYYYYNHHLQSHSDHASKQLASSSPKPDLELPSNSLHRALESEQEYLKSASFSSQSKYEAKIARFQEKKEKLITKNKRLRSEHDIKVDQHKQKKRYKLNKLKHAYFAKETAEYEEFMQLLTDADIILKTQMIHHYIVFVVKIYVGLNIATTLNRNAHVIDKYNEIVMHEDEAVDDEKKPEEYDFRVTRISSVFPLVRHPRWDSQMRSLSFNTNVLKREIVANNEFSFGILTERTVYRTLNSLNIRNYEIYPFFLNKKNEWVVFEDDIYFSTIYKDYIVQSQNSRQRDIVDNTYRLTQNILDAMVIVNNKYGHICLFSTKAGIFMTDPRLKYKDVKKPWNSELKHDENESEEKSVSRRTRTRSRGWSLSSKNTHEINTKVSNAIRCKIDMYLESAIIKLFHCGDDQIYALYDDGALYRLFWNDDNIELSKKDYNKLVDSVDDQQPNYRFTRVGARESDVYISGGPRIRVELEKDDPMKQRLTELATSKFEEKCNDDIRKHNLIAIAKHKQFQLGSSRNAKIKDFLIYGIYFCEQHSVLYMCQQKQSNISHWTLTALGGVKEAPLVAKYESLFASFMESNQYLQDEFCYIMFVDNRDVNDSYIIIILNQYLLRIPMLGNSKMETQSSFARVYDVNECVPDLKDRCAGCKWHFSYDCKSLFLFEKITSSSAHSYRFRRVTLDSFRF